MRRPLIVLASFAITASCAAQYVPEETPPNANLVPYKLDHLNQIKFSPIRVVDPINPGFEISYERLYGRFSTQLSGAWLVEVLEITKNDEYQGVRVAIEEKFFVARTHKIRPYVAVDFVHHQIHIRRTDKFGPSREFDHPNDNDTLSLTYYKDNYSIDKRMSTVNAKVGVQVNLHRVVLDVCYGIGLKWKDIRHTKRFDPTDFRRGSRHPSPTDQAYDEGRTVNLNIPINFKVGYLF